MQIESDPYDTVAYPGFPYPDTHPGHLAAMAILHGLSPAPVERCRVLEIACGDGSNLIPMAYAIPGSEFTGFDLAHLPIERGQQRIRELALTNIRLFQADILNAGSELGCFDYIVAHGLYSWVPEAVSDRLLSLCRELLAPQGVAFVSYAARPGGYLRNLIREMMLYRAHAIEDPEEKTAAAVAFVRFAINARPQSDPFRALIDEQLKRFETRSPHAIFHDELNEFHRPVLFSGFIEHARSHGLQYLCEAVLPPPPDPCYRSDLHSGLQAIAADDLIAHEQILDFMRMRMYRETLLCRAECEIRRDFPPEQLRRLNLASQATSSSGQDPGAKPGEEPGAKIFTLPGGIKMETAHPATIALMCQLEAAWPRALSFDEIAPQLAEAGFRLDHEGITLLMRLAIGKMIEFHAWKPPIAAAISDRPSASASARQEARIRAHVTTLWHTAARLDDPLVRTFLVLLDGSRDRAGLLDALRIEYPDLPSEQLEQGIEPNLRHMHRVGMLEA